MRGRDGGGDARGRGACEGELHGAVLEGEAREKGQGRGKESGGVRELAVSETLKVIQGLVSGGRVRISEHGRQELSDDQIDLASAIAGAASARVVEDYPNYAKGPCVLCLQHDDDRRPIHVLWAWPATRLMWQL